MNRFRNLIGLAASAAMLSGCQGFPLGKWAFAKPRSASQAGVADVASSEATLQEGRQQLEQGRISEAIASFRMAMVAPDTRAEATNGLAVAYAKLGRPDLADRYFREAATLDPDNPKFAANLLRLQQRTILMAAEERATMLADASVPPTPVAAPAQDAPLAQNDSLVRVSRGEVHLALSTEQTAAPRMIVRSRMAAADAPPVAPKDPSKLAVRDSPAAPAAEAAAKEKPASASKTIVYPVRLELSGSSRTARVSKLDSSPAYPIRIALGG
jgi:tetratricopeptide (TPR) repeat protein